MEECWPAVICLNSSCLKEVRKPRLPKYDPRVPQGKSSWKSYDAELGIKNAKQVQDETQVKVSDL